MEYYDRYASAEARLIWTPPQLAKTLRDEAIEKRSRPMS
jgi:hypothetical protein